MKTPRPRFLRRFVPPNFQDPVGLTVRLLRSRDWAAYFALGTTLLAFGTTPLDLLLQVAERRLYRRARPPEKPIILVTGAPRSGTTLLSQVLLEHLPVTYFNNLTALFPRAPIMANRLLGRFLRAPRRTYRSFYGRTSGFAAENDALHLWDRWMGPDRYAVPDHLDPHTADAMVRFFGAYEAAFGKPILNKNNALATCASLVSRTLPTSHIIFIRREARFAAQSIIVARETIQGTRDAPYGVSDPRRATDDASPTGYIADVCAQVLYHERKMDEQAREIGAQRFWAVDYEDFCREPHSVVLRAAREILGISLDEHALRRRLPPFQATNRVTLPRDEFAKIEETLARLAGSARTTRREAGAP